MTAKRHLKIKIDEEKCKVLKDLENGRSKKDVSEKYGIPRNTICKWLKNKEKICSDLEKSSTRPERKKMCTAGL